MATVGVHALKGNVQNAINYIIQKCKTEPNICESLSCNMHCAGIEWELKNNRGRQGRKTMVDDVVGYHFHQSFAAGTVTKEEAFEIAKEWMDRILNGKYDYVIATHKDTEHIHTHIIVNPYHNESGRKMRIFFKKDLPVFKELSDQVCKEHGLDVLDPVNVKYERTYYEWLMKNKGDSHKDRIRKALDYAIANVKDYQELKQYLTQLGFTVEDGSEEGNNRLGLRIKAPNKQYFVRCNRILCDEGGTYSLEEVKQRIEENGVFVSKPEIKELIGTSMNKKQMNEAQLSFYEKSNIKLGFKESGYYNMSSSERMLLAKRNNILKMVDEINDRNAKGYMLDHLEEFRNQRSELQDRIDEVTRQLRINESNLHDILRQRMENVLHVSDQEIDDSVENRITPLREEKELLKKEISELSESINKADHIINKYEKEHDDIER